MFVLFTPALFVKLIFFSYLKENDSFCIFFSGRRLPKCKPKLVHVKFKSAFSLADAQISPFLNVQTKFKFHNEVGGTINGVISGTYMALLPQQFYWK